MRLLVSGLGWTLLKLIYHIFISTLKNHNYSLSHKISTVRSIREFNTVSVTNNFRHPKLNREELRNGCKLGLDIWADTDCSGKYAYVEKFIIGKMVTAMGFLPSLEKLENLTYAHVLYAYDQEDGSVLLLEHENTIYLGDAMQDSLSNPIQSEEIGIRIDLRPKLYYSEDSHAQTINFPKGMVLPILYDGVLPFIPVRRPTPFKIENSMRLELTSRDDWDPYHLQNKWAAVNSQSSSHFLYTDADPISIDLMPCKMLERAASHQLLYATRNSETSINQDCTFYHKKGYFQGELFLNSQTIKYHVADWIKDS